ncbi:MAG: T9SS type A sorting domain-containing protein [Cytophagales bacterium]|nr:T9SS type A sorting domain-containing protein [Cytophagales bacterium]
MKKTLLSCLLACASYFSYSQQCSETPVVEAVRNGDFEAGYLPGSTIGAVIPSHTFTPGGDFDFESDLDYAGEWKSPSDPCLYGMADRYGVGRVEKITNGCSGRESIVYGQYTGAANYTDHTTGTDQGFSLFVDFNAISSSYKTAWAQTVEIQPSQQYYFSAWFAQYGSSQSIPTLRLRVETFDANGTLIETATVSPAPVAPPAMSWQQFSGTYDSPSNAVTAKLFIECLPNGNFNGNDFMIDDISFVNGCQNVENKVTSLPFFEEEEISLCQNNGSVNLTLTDGQGNAFDGTNKTITWYQGSGNTQTEINSFANATSQQVTEKNSYRVCVEDPNNDCAVSTTIEVTEELAIKNIPTDLELCSPAKVDLDADLGYDGLVYSWTGAKTSSNSSIIIDKAGEYTIEASLPQGNCFASQKVIVTSSLPTIPTDLVHCNGVATLAGTDNQTTWRWCEDAECNTVINTDKNEITWNVPVGASGSQIVYLQNAETVNLGTVGATSLGSVSSLIDTKTTYFTVSDRIFLKSLDVQHNPWNGGCRSGIKKNITVQIPQINFSKQVQITCGQISTVDLGVDLNPGEYTIVFDGDYYTTGTVSNPSIEGAIELQNRNTLTSTHFAPIANLVVEQSLSCDPVPVTIQACSGPEFDGESSICAGTEGIYTVSNPNPTSSYTWTYNNETKTAGSLSVNFEEVELTDNQLEISLTETYANGSISLTTTQLITVESIAAPTIEGLSNVCEDTKQTYNVDENSIGLFNWTYTHSGENVITAQGSEIEIDFANQIGTTNISVTATNLSGCVSDEGEITVEIAETPQPILEANSEEICIGDLATVSLSNSSNSSIIKWFINEESINANTSSVDQIIETTTNIFLVEETNINGCIATAQKEIIGLLAPTEPEVIIPIETCDTDSALFRIKSPNSDYTYGWDSDADISINPVNASKDSIYVKFSAIQETNELSFSVNATNQAGCSSEIVDFTSSVVPTPSEVSITGEESPCEKETYTYAASSENTESYNWFYLDGDALMALTNNLEDDAQEINFSNMSAVTGEIQVEAVNGTCITSATFPVTIDKNCVVTNLVTIEDSQASITPNPFDNTTTIYSEAISSITIYDMNGKVVNVFENTNKVTVGDNLPLGIYFVGIQNEYGVSYTKIIKQ